MSFSNLFDHYSFRARLQPALFTAIPLALGVFAWAPPGTRWISALWSLVVAGGGTSFLASEIRNAGVRIEPELWKTWGGAPTTQLLSWNGPANPNLRQRWHSSLEKLLSQSLPTLQEEQSDPQQATEKYDAAIQLLRAKTRNVKQFPLVYAENINYGFCRNLYGAKKLGITLCAIGLTLSILSSLNSAWVGRLDYLPWVCSGFCLLLMCKWLFTINSDWVRVPAFGYAYRLLESIDICLNPIQASTPKKRNSRKKNSD